MRIEKSDRYFIEKIRPIITQKAINAAIRPLGYSVSSKGRTDKKQGQVYLIMRPVKGGIHPTIECTMNGSLMLQNDGIGCVYSWTYTGSNEIRISYSGRPQRDRDRFLRGLRDSVKAWIAHTDRRL